jgi:hypothetical protein
MVTTPSLYIHCRYEQQGDFLRYLSTQNILIITFDETQFYAMNKQEPIVRIGEVFFHDVLFTTTVISIFALAFLIVKLTFMPIVRWIINREVSLLQFSKLQKKIKTEKNTRFITLM